MLSDRGYKGKALKVLRAGTLLAAVRAKSVSHSKGPIDRSDEEKSGWRYLDKKTDSRSVELSVSGVATIDNYQILSTEWLGTTLTDISIMHANGTLELAEDGAFLSSLAYEGSRDGAVVFSATFTLSGLITFVEELMLTSRPYSLESRDALRLGSTARGGRYDPFVMEGLSLGASALESELEAVLVAYDGYLTEQLELAASATGGAITGVDADSYDNYDPEGIEIAATAGDGTLDAVLVSYTHYDAESVQLTATATGGTLT